MLSSFRPSANELPLTLNESEALELSVFSLAVSEVALEKRFESSDCHRPWIEGRLAAGGPTPVVDFEILVLKGSPQNILLVISGWQDACGSWSLQHRWNNALIPPRSIPIELARLKACVRFAPSPPPYALHYSFKPAPPLFQLTVSLLGGVGGGWGALAVERFYATVNRFCEPLSCRCRDVVVVIPCSSIAGFPHFQMTPVSSPTGGVHHVNVTYQTLLGRGPRLYQERVNLPAPVSGEPLSTHFARFHVADKRNCDSSWQKQKATEETASQMVRKAAEINRHSIVYPTVPWQRGTNMDTITLPPGFLKPLSEGVSDI
ncbi:hypothetical protein MRX96_001885 [Rhipicephalus microplus]